ncbi:MAG: ABC transporter permease [Legionellales bacterium RIFCSPHIGHO2_12_FULL_35_11]|nr:MAG: ABC transporter permease [Legionellales bacterium RIFCSPHIGHO2_12_FULL_35_11]
MIEMIERIGEKSIARIQVFGNSGIFLLRVIFRMPDIKRLLPALRDQMYSIGVLSFLIIFVSALFIGMVVGLQGYNTLRKFGATSQLGQLLALSVARELGPVITALLFAGRAGSALTAEIGLMKSTEQLTSMDMMGIDPLQKIVYPRFLAGIITMPVLSIIFAAVSIYGGYLIGVIWLGVDSGSFWSNMQAAVDFRIDIFSGIIKSVVFALAVIWIAVFQGYTCVPNASGISQATTRTVVYSSVAVLGLDFLLTAVMIGGW